MAVFEQVKREDLKNLKDFSKKKKFSEEKPKTIYEELRLKGSLGGKEVNLILYTSGKLLVQGKEDAVKELAEELEKLGIGEKTKSEQFRKESGWIIGTDESLKGDTFGGLVVAGVKANNEMRKKLLELGAADSKKLADREILVLAERIKRTAPCEIKSLLPEEYNSDGREGKVTKLLNKLHQECGNYLSPGKHVVDKYPGCSVGDLQLEKAESKYVEVAAASILARASALKQLDYLSAQAGFRLPKGSAHVNLALHEMKDRGLEFKKFAKIDFANVKEFL